MQYIMTKSSTVIELPRLSSNPTMRTGIIRSSVKMPVKTCECHVKLAVE